MPDPFDVFLSSPVVSLSWGNVGSLAVDQRDLLIASAGRGTLYRFRCNSFGDALRSALIAGELIRKRPA